MNKPILNTKSMEITRGALPGSRKVHVGGVPFREVALSGGETPIQLYETLLAGPKRWRLGGKLAGGTTVESLPAQLQAILERMLTSELVQMMERWVAWDIRKLREKRNALIEAEKAAEGERRAAVAAASAAAKPPRRRITAKDREDNPRPNYRPPPRT